MSPAPRQILTPRPSMRLSIPEGMTPVEFFNSPANLKNLAEENGLFRTPEDLLMYRKLIGHSTEFDTSIILDTSRRILDPLGRPVRRDQLVRLAREYLGDPDLKVEAIARHLGYSGSNNFVRAFRRMSGLTPSQFRRRDPSAR